MSKLHDHMMQLVREIDEACKAEKLPYTLMGRTAGVAKAYDKFPTQCCEFHIMMLSRDAAKLVEVLSKYRSRGHEIEDRVNNPELPTNIIRYVDVETTLYDRENPVKYRKPGIAVTIHPLFSQQPVKNSNGLLVRFVKKFADGGVYRDMIADGRKGYGKTVWWHKNGSEGEYENWIALDKEYVTNTRTVTFMGQKLPVPQKDQEYFELMYGSKWKKLSKEPLPSANRIFVICDPDCSYQEMKERFSQAGYDFEDLQDEVREYYRWCRKVLKPAERPVSLKYEMARRSVDRIDQYCEYQKILPELEKAARENDMDTLETLMKKYLRKTEKYYKWGLGFYINKKLFDFASLVWKAKGQEGFAKEVYALVPEVYKQEDVGDILANQPYME